jgi:hypothetical protein
MFIDTEFLYWVMVAAGCGFFGTLLGFVCLTLELLILRRRVFKLEVDEEVTRVATHQHHESIQGLEDSVAWLDDYAANHSYDDHLWGE